MNGTDPEYTDIMYEVKDRIAHITLNRPEKLNALSNNLRAELIHAMKWAESEPEVGVIVLAGSGRAFSAGYDLTLHEQLEKTINMSIPNHYSLTLELLIPDHRSGHDT